MNKPFVIRTLCSGYDSQKSALLRIAAEHPDTFSVFLASWSDIDAWACKGHDQLYPEDIGLNVGDMTKVDWSKCPYPDIPTDLLTYSTPCQDISQAGKQAGFEEGSSTRSGILWHTEDAIRHLRPRFLLQENVRAIINGYPRKSEPMMIPFVLDLNKTKQDILTDIAARLATFGEGYALKVVGRQMWVTGVMCKASSTPPRRYTCEAVSFAREDSRVRKGLRLAFFESESEATLIAISIKELFPELSFEVVRRSSDR